MKTLSNNNRRNTSFILFGAALLLGGCGGSDDGILTVGNQPPEISVKPVAVVQASQSHVDLNASARDDASGVTWQWRQVSGFEVQLEDADKPVARFATPVVNFRDGQQQLVFNVTATDREGASDSETVAVDIEPNNQAPQLSLAARLSRDEQTGTELSVAASDDKAIIGYQWRQIAGPQVQIEDANSQTARFVTPTVLVTDGIQSLDFEVTVTDSDNVQTLARTSVNVNPVNALPEVSVEAPPVAIADSVAELKATATDPDGLIESYQWRQVSGPQVTWVKTEGSTANFLVPSITDYVEASFEVVVSDNETAQASKAFTVPLAAKPQLPVGLVVSTDQVVDEQQPVALFGALTDGYPSYLVNFKWRQIDGPSVALSNTTEARASFNAPVVLANEGNQTLTFELAVSDFSGPLLSAKTKVVVKPVNVAPTAVITAVSSAQIGDKVILSVDAADGDGSLSSIEWHQLSGPQVTLNQLNANQSDFTVPQLSESAAATFEVVVTDNEMTVTRAQTSVFLSVENVPPQLTVTAPDEVDEQIPVVLAVLAEDAAGIDSVRWTQLSGPAVELTGEQTSVLHFTAPVVSMADGPQTLVFKVEVTAVDGQGSSEQVEVIVNPVNTNPQIGEVAAQLVAVNAQVNIKATASDTDGSVSSYLWRQVGGTEVILSNANADTLSFTAPGEAAKLSFELTATDNESSNAVQTAVVHVVQDPEQAVIVETDSQLTPKSGATTRLSWQAVSLNEPVAAVLTQQSGKQTLTFVMDGPGKAYFDAPVVLTEDANDTYQLKLTVTDSKGNQAAQTIDIAPTYLPSQFKARQVLLDASDGVENFMFKALDIDNDGLTDIANLRRDGWYWLKNLGDDRFDEARLITKLANSYVFGYTQFLDVDGNGTLDALYLNKEANTQTLQYLPFENGDFGAPQTIAVLDPTWQEFQIDEFQVHPLDDSQSGRPQLLFGYADGSQNGLVETYRWVDGAYVRVMRQETGRVSTATPRSTILRCQGGGQQRRYLCYPYSGDRHSGVRSPYLFPASANQLSTGRLDASVQSKRPVFVVC